MGENVENADLFHGNSVEQREKTILNKFKLIVVFAADRWCGK